MKEFWNTIQLIFTAIGGWLGWFLGGCDGLLYALIAFVVIDYITGVMCAITDKKLSSAIGFKGICRKVLIFLLVGIGHIVDMQVIGSGNEGEVPQYSVENSHEAIIAPEEWEAVQSEFQRRKMLGRHYSENSPLAARIVCGECGSFYGPKVWHSTDKYRRTVWQCNRKFKNTEKCTTPHLDEKDIKARFLVAVNSLLDGKESLLEDCRIIQEALTDCSEFDRQTDELLQELEVITELTRRCVEDNASNAQSQEEYAIRYNGYVERYESTKAKLEALQRKCELRRTEADEIGAFMFELAELDESPLEFDDHLWLATVKLATVQPDESIVFTFRNGTQVTA